MPILKKRTAAEKIARTFERKSVSGWIPGKRKKILVDLFGKCDLGGDVWRSVVDTNHKFTIDSIRWAKYLKPAEKEMVADVFIKKGDLKKIMDLLEDAQALGQAHSIDPKFTDSLVSAVFSAVGTGNAVKGNNPESRKLARKIIKRAWDNLRTASQNSKMENGYYRAFRFAPEVNGKFIEVVGDIDSEESRFRVRMLNSKKENDEADERFRKERKKFAEAQARKNKPVLLSPGSDAIH